jgi:hypothetical protein
MNWPRSSFDGFPLFAGEADIWKSLDEPTKEHVLDYLAVLLLRHLEQTAAYPQKKSPSQKEAKHER